jgi:hypothetical protein
MLLRRCFEQGSCSGLFITHVNTPTKEDCLRTCSDRDLYPNCNWFSYYSLTRVCSLFATCVLDGDETGVVSGERACSAYQGGISVAMC